MPESFNIKVDNKEMSQYLEAFSEDMQDVLKGLKKSLDKINKLDLKINERERKILFSLNNSMKRLSKKRFAVEDHTNFNSLESQVRALITAIDKLEIPKTIDLKQPTLPKQKIINQLDLEPIKQITKILTAMFRTAAETRPVRIENLDEFPQAFEQAQPDKFKTLPTTHNTALTTAETEYTTTLSDSTKAVMIQLRGSGDVSIKLGDSSNFWTLKSGASISIQGFVSKVVAKCSADSQTLEIIELH